MMGSMRSDVNADVVRLSLAVMARHGIPGMSVAVTDRHGLRCHCGFGTVDLRTGLATGASTRYPWFAISRLITVAAVLRLTEEGRFDLNTPCTSYLPPSDHPSINSAVTLRHLLESVAGEHGGKAPGRSGRDVLNVALRRSPHGYRRDDRRHSPASDPPGDAGPPLLDAVVAAATGRTLHKVRHDLVLDPLGMTKASLGPWTDVATGHIRRPHRSWPRGQDALTATTDRVGPYLILNPLVSARTSDLAGDAGDAAALICTLLLDGTHNGVRVLSSDSVQIMRELYRLRPPSTPRNSRNGSGSTHLQQVGAGPGYYGLLRVYPSSELGIAILTNSATSDGVDQLCAALHDAFR